MIVDVRCYIFISDDLVIFLRGTVKKGHVYDTEVEFFTAVTAGGSVKFLLAV